MLRSIRPKRARRPSDASVDPTGARIPRPIFSELGSLAPDGRGDEDGQGRGLTGRESRGGGEDPTQEKLGGDTGSLLEHE